MRLLFATSAFLVLLVVAPAHADKLVLFGGGGAGDDGVPATKARLVERSASISTRRAMPISSS